MNITERIKKFNERRKVNKSLRKFRNKAVVRARFIFMWLIGSGVFGFLWALSCVFTHLPVWWAFIPGGMLVLYFLAGIIRKNWRPIVVYVCSIEKGRLLLFLNQVTHFSYDHKMKLIRWIYPRKNEIRNERKLELGNKIMSGIPLDKAEKRDYKKKTVTCPQQLLDGFNKALLVHTLIYCHQNIQVLDNEIRKIMDLTDDHIHSFDLQSEINRCRTREEREKIDKYMEIGRNASKNRKK